LRVAHLHEHRLPWSSSLRCDHHFADQRAEIGARQIGAALAEVARQRRDARETAGASGDPFGTFAVTDRRAYWPFFTVSGFTPSEVATGSER
jgi:hypothetical protein